MKAIEGGKTKVSHPNTGATETKARPGISGPKTMDGGMDLSGNATNSKGKVKDLGMEESQSSRAHSFNQYRGGR